MRRRARPSRSDHVGFPEVSRGHRADAGGRPPRGGAARLSQPHVKAGITTGELDRIAHDYQVNVQHVVPATLNYAPPGHRPYPASICTSVNHVVCHGIPGDKKLKPGDIVNIDVTVIKDGFHGDTSRMFYVGTPSIQAKRLVRGHVRGDVAGHPRRRAGRAARRHRPHDPAVRRSQRFSVVREFCGHGIGRAVPRGAAGAALRPPRTGLELQPGMIFTIEPMINAGRAAIRALADGWTIVTADHSLSAQWEHTVLVTRRLRGADAVAGGAPPPPVA